MYERKTKLMIEDNTIYEIDLECLREREEQKKRTQKKEDRKKAETSRTQRA